MTKLCSLATLCLHLHVYTCTIHAILLVTPFTIPHCPYPLTCCLSITDMNKCKHEWFPFIFVFVCVHICCSHSCLTLTLNHPTHLCPSDPLTPSYLSMPSTPIHPVPPGHSTICTCIVHTHVGIYFLFPILLFS